jgi:hypothetical protein
MKGQAFDPVRDDSFAAKRRAAGDRKLKALLRRAETGDRDAVWRLRDLLADDPDRFVALGRGDLAAVAIDTIAYVVANPKWRDRKRDLDGLHWFAIATRARQLLAELCPPGMDSPVERLLAERVAVTWIACNYHEMEAAAHAVHGEGWDRLAAQKGRSTVEGAVLGFVFGPLGVLVEALLPTVRNRNHPRPAARGSRPRGVWVPDYDDEWDSPVDHPTDPTEEQAFGFLTGDSDAGWQGGGKPRPG